MFLTAVCEFWQEVWRSCREHPKIFFKRFNQISEQNEKSVPYLVPDVEKVYILVGGLDFTCRDTITIHRYLTDT